MTGDEPMLVACGTVDRWDALDSRLRSALIARDGPYDRRACDTCKVAVVVGREACAMLADGRANQIICTDCLVGAALAFEREALK